MKFVNKMLSAKVIKASKTSGIILSQFRCLSNQVNGATDWESAKPYDEIPGPKNLFQFLRLVAPGGKYYNLPLNELASSFKRDYGTLTRMPGIFGQKQIVLTFRPEDIETVFRTEGKFPYRRPFESMEYFRKKQRPDLYPAGAGLTIT